MKNSPFVLLVYCLLQCIPAVAQQPLTDSNYVYIDTILLEGNRKTKNALLFRDLEFRQGDSILRADLEATLKRNSLRLLNLNLFTIVDIQVVEWRPGNHAVLRIKMIETWFVLPIPVFELSDRNFNVWWKQFNRSLRRVNYGLDLVHNNVSGYADRLKLRFGAGFNNIYEVAYRLPPLNKGQTLQLQTSLAYTRQHEVAYTTTDNIVRFRRDPNAWNITQILGTINLNWRPGLNNFHNFILEYRDIRVSDSIGVILNPDFFLNARTQQQHFSLVYIGTQDLRDIRPYPLHGTFSRIEIRQNGLLPTDDLHLFRVFAERAWYFPLVKNLYADIAIKGRTSLPRRKPPYYNNQALGYFGNFVRGYEYIVSDGLDFAVLKTAFHFEFLNRVFQLGKFMPLKTFKTLPLKLYLSFNNDTGFSNDPYYRVGNPLANKLLYGYGLGLDVVAWYNKTARFEFSWNDIGQRGFFLRIDSGF
jgi:outer membrane protein assembly factor BamA